MDRDLISTTFKAFATRVTIRSQDARPTNERAMSRPYHTYTVEELQYIRDNYAEVSAADIAARLGVSKRTVYQLAHKMGLYKDKAYIIRVAREASSKSTHGGVVTRFKPGVPSFNKGKKMEDYCTPEAIARSARTRFKAGHRPKNWRPVGSERVSKDGYIEVKMREGIRGWDMKHKVVWEKHNGKVPKGYKISFRDGNTQNCDISNLYLITFEELMRKNQIHNSPEEIKEVIYLRGRITREVNKQKRNGK